MKLRYFLIGLIFIILGFLAFSYMAVANKYLEINSSMPLILIAIGFFLIFLGIISMFLFLMEDKTEKEDKVK